MKQSKLPTNKITEQPIFDEELEINTLACIAYGEHSKINMLDEDDFYSIDTKALFVEMRDFYEENQKIALVSVYSNLRKIGIDITLPSDMYIVPDAATFSIKSLKEISNSRKLQDLAYRTTVKTAEGQSVVEIKEWLTLQVSKIGTDYSVKEISNEELDKRFFDMLEESNTSPVTSGIQKLDDRIGGFDKGTLTILAAAQGVGKTTLAINLTNHICGNLNKRVLYVSLEMPFDTLDLMQIANLTGISYFRMKHLKEGLSTQQWLNVQNARLEIRKYKMIRMGEQDITIEDIRYKLKEKQPDIVIIDYLQKLESTSKFNGEYEKLTNISRKLKTIANEFKVPVVAIASINREYTKRNEPVPKVSDIRGSGSIEYDADLVLLLHRDSAFSKFKGKLGGTEEYKFNHNAYLYIAKNRFGVSNKRIPLDFDGEKCLITQREEDDDFGN